ncbi:MAG: 3-deoxy-D-manno-octulosonic acid transferase [Nitrospirae bacterium]|nr:3-deoxy-D-manno-octulosonic acid transferase [Nitrospirota bacterium]
MFLLYNLLSISALLIYSPWLLFKKGPESKLTFLSERFGVSWYVRTDIWIHAVSVGETLAALPFLKALKKEFPCFKIVLSTTTYTGQKIAREKFPEADRIMYMPVDAWLCINRAVKLLAPKVFITVETELWPQLFKKLKDNGSHIAVLNGRISNESFKGYKRISPFIKKVLSYVDFFYMQSKEDAGRIIALGAGREKVKVMGNFKFDLNLPASQHAMSWMDAIGGHILVAGSTHKGEEEIILNAFNAIKSNTAPETYDLKLILAPRHPERFQEAEDILKKRGINYIRRSEISVDSSQLTVDSLEADVILLDTIGELSEVYSRAAIAFVGGSLLPLGGHNILEPAYWAKPVIFGPHMENFAIASEFLKQGAALEVKDSADIANAVTDLLKYTDKAKEMGQKAKDITDSNTGAVKKAVELIRDILAEARQNGGA